MTGVLNEVLQRDPWYRGLAARVQDAIEAHGLRRRFTNEMIYIAGDPPNGLFALLDGDIRIAQVTGDGRYALLMVPTAGAWFGEASMIDGLPRSSEALALGSVEVFHISRLAYAQLATTQPLFHRAMAELVCRQYRKAIDHLSAASNRSLSTRLAQRLFSLSSYDEGSAGKNDGVRRLSQEALASTLGVTRQTLNRALKRMETDGVVSVGYGRVTILDSDQLQILALA